MRTKKRDELYCGVRQEVIANAKPVINWENVYHFKRFVLDRYRIHKRKDVKGLPAPVQEANELRDKLETWYNHDVKGMSYDDEYGWYDPADYCF